MRSIRPTDVAAVLLGVAFYVAVAGWLFVVPIALLPALFLSGLGASAETANAVSRQIIGVVVFVGAGYLTGRASEDAALQTSAFLGLVLYVLSTFLNRALWASFNADVPLDVLTEVRNLVRAIVATIVGGTIALWQSRTRGARRLDVRSLPRKIQFALLVAAIVPFLLLALTFRP